jgi:Transposase-associated domain
MEGDRSWMYSPFRINPEFIYGVRSFLNYAFNNPANIIDGDCIRCPCLICGNSRWYKRDTIEEHLIRSGFRNYYSTWYMHGEECRENLDDNIVRSPLVEESFEGDRSNPIEQMVRDAAGPDFNLDSDEETPNSEAEKFYEMLKAADEPLWDGCDTRYTRLSCVTELLTIKTDCNLTKEAFNQIVSAVKKWIPPNNRLPPNYYQCKKLVQNLGLGYQKIDACPNHCMLYYGSNSLKVSCDVCHHPRIQERNEFVKGKPIPYKVLRYLPITERLQRLYMSPATAGHMRWHKEGVRDKEGVMVHPADCQA